MYDYLKIAILLLLFTASIFIVFWVFRPGTTKRYKEFSKIPLKNDFHLEGKKSSERKGKRKKAKK
ncbi:MAG: cbb3-type cytochrome oxidase subunit 3 [Gammaproteobacteria bacterium]